MGDGTNSGPGPGGSSRLIPWRVLIGIGSLVVSIISLIAWFVLLVTGDWNTYLLVIGVVSMLAAYNLAGKE